MAVEYSTVPEDTTLLVAEAPKKKTGRVVAAAVAASLILAIQKEDPYYDGRMGCTYMYCETPKEPKCLKYIGETEKN